MTKLTKDEGNSGTVPDALKVGQELRSKIDAHEAELAKKGDWYKGHDPLAAQEAPNNAAHNHVAASSRPAHADQPISKPIPKAKRK